jgi:hypothetical protein
MNSPATSKPIHDALNPRKAIKSMLDPYKEQLLQMDRDNKTIAEIHAWLATQSVSCSPSNVQQFLATRRGERKRDGMLGHLVDGAKTGQEVERLLARHPAPKIETIIKLFRVLSVQLSTEGATDPKMTKLADQLARTVLGFISNQTQAAFRERKLAMEEVKHAEWIKCEQTRALQLCLKEAKKFPLVARAFRNAFTALKATRTPALRQVDSLPSQAQGNVPASPAK